MDRFTGNCEATILTHGLTDPDKGGKIYLCATANFLINGENTFKDFCFSYPVYYLTPEFINGRDETDEELAARNKRAFDIIHGQFRTFFNVEIKDLEDFTESVLAGKKGMLSISWSEKWGEQVGFPFIRKMSDNQKSILDKIRGKKTGAPAGNNGQTPQTPPVDDVPF